MLGRCTQARNEGSFLVALPSFDSHASLLKCRSVMRLRGERSGLPPHSEHRTRPLAGSDYQLSLHVNRIAVSPSAVQTGTMPFLRTSIEELSVLRNNLDQAHVILRSIELPQGRAQLAVDLIKASLHITDDLLSRKPVADPGSAGRLDATDKPQHARRLAVASRTRPKKGQ